jgi:uncharacterized protein
MNYSETIASNLHVKPSQVEATIRLLDEGNTVPFISRYRKEMTGTLDDEQSAPSRMKLSAFEPLTNAAQPS